MKRWYAENKDKMRVARLRWYYKNKEKSAKAHKVYASKNQEKINEKAKIWRTGNKRYWAKASKAKITRRQEASLKVKKESGGKCARCGYCEEVRILHFHHHLGIKNTEVSALLEYRQMKEEAKLCILLCPNCHALIHLKPICH